MTQSTAKGTSRETKKIAELIAEGIRMEGSEAQVVNVTGIKKETDFAGYDAYVFGSATYHGEMMQGMLSSLVLPHIRKGPAAEGGLPPELLDDSAAVDEAVRQDPGIYPSKETRAQFITLKEPSDKEMRELNRIWTRLKANR